MKKFFFIPLIFTFFILVVIFVVVIKLPNIQILKNHYPVVSYSESKIKPSVHFKKQRPLFWISIQDIPQWVKGAVVTSEDWAFYQHSGIDWAQLKDALKDSFKKEEWVRGASTISQQVVKNLFLTHEKSLVRKVKEFVLVFQLEKMQNQTRFYSKKNIQRKKIF